ncbi:MAG TPA: hypothetical protein VNL71_13320 [Chloroflexota bacterium]|nr:hypothetical protein [Chloroflexota bacterium]
MIQLVATPTVEEDHYQVALACDSCRQPIDHLWQAQILANGEIPRGPLLTVHPSCVGPYLTAHPAITIWASGTLARLGLDLGAPAPLRRVILGDFSYPPE